MRFLTFCIRKHERGLVFRHGDFVRLLAPGKHRLWSRLLRPWACRVQIVDTLRHRFEHTLLESLVTEPALRDALEVLNLGSHERALVWVNGRLEALLRPGRYAYWKSAPGLSIETFDVRDGVFEHERIESVLDSADAHSFFTTVVAKNDHADLLFRNGVFVGRLEPGRHVFWRGANEVSVVPLDLRERVLDVSGQEIMTADKVTLRVNLIVTFQVVDPVKAVTVTSAHDQALYREAQLALRAAVGGRSLDALLADKESIGGEVKNALAERANAFGVTVRSVGLRDIILPGEMKSILNQVIEAQKQSEANLIRRREETAAARSQANTARLLEENPALQRLKELEALQAILTGAKATFVLGSTDMVGELRKVVASSVANGPDRAADRNEGVS